MSENTNRFPSWNGQTKRTAAWFSFTSFLAAVHYASFDFTNTPLVTDIRLYVYFATQKAAGAVPYRDFFDIKTPLSIFAGSLLIQAGEIAQIDALTAIRVGYLFLAAAIPLLYFVVHTRLEPGQLVPGFLAGCAFLGFPLLGFMPSVGNVPKMLVAFFAVTAFILVGRRMWFLAGVSGALAFLDWQIGILALVAVFAGALSVIDQRVRSALRVVTGAVWGLAPFVLYFWLHDALRIAVQQTVFFAAMRGESASLGLHGNARHILRVIEDGCGGHQWLFVLAIIGAATFPLMIKRHLRGTTRCQLVSLSVYHYGIVAYSLIDFQRYGDLFILLHSLAFFLGIAFIEFYRILDALISRNRTIVSTVRWKRGLPIILVCMIAVAATRPSILREEYLLTSKDFPRNLTLADQKEVNEALQKHIHGKKIAFINSVEQLVLSHRQNDILYAGWSPGNYYRARYSESENPAETWYRVIKHACPEVFTRAGKVRVDQRLSRFFDPVHLVSANGAYRVEVFVLKDSSSSDRYKREFCSVGDGVLQDLFLEGF